MPAIRRFMIVLGLVSSVFDILTFTALRVVFDAGADLLVAIPAPALILLAVLTGLYVTANELVKRRAGLGMAGGR